jgi:hypothetical protein
MCGAIYLTGFVYAMSFTAILGFSPRTLWVTLPAWTFLFAALVKTYYDKQKGD